jgi:hypothetical protein
VPEIEQLHHDNGELQQAKCAEVLQHAPPQNILLFRNNHQLPMGNGNNDIHRKKSIRFCWIDDLGGGIVVGTVFLVDFMKTINIQFTPDDPGNTLIALSELVLHDTPQE